MKKILIAIFILIVMATYAEAERVVNVTNPTVVFKTINDFRIYYKDMNGKYDNSVPADVVKKLGRGCVLYHPMDMRLDKKYRVDIDRQLFRVYISKVGFGYIVSDDNNLLIIEDKR